MSWFNIDLQVGAFVTIEIPWDPKSHSKPKLDGIQGFIVAIHSESVDDELQHDDGPIAVLFTSALAGPVLPASCFDEHGETILHFLPTEVCPAEIMNETSLTYATRSMPVFKERRQSRCSKGECTARVRQRAIRIVNGLVTTIDVCQAHFETIHGTVKGTWVPHK